MPSKNNTVDRKHILDSLLRTMRNRILYAQWRLASRRMTHLYDSYLFESGWSSETVEGTVDYPAEIRPQRMPGLPHATTKQTLNRGRRGSRGNHTVLCFFLFFSITHRTNGGEISLFFLLCDVHREHSTSFFFILSTVGGHAASRCNGSLCSEERKYLGGFFVLPVVTSRMFTVNISFFHTSYKRRTGDIAHMAWWTKRYMLPLPVPVNAARNCDPY